MSRWEMTADKEANELKEKWAKIDVYNKQSMKEQ